MLACFPVVLLLLSCLSSPFTAMTLRTCQLPNGLHISSSLHFIRGKRTWAQHGICQLNDHQPTFSGPNTFTRCKSISSVGQHCRSCEQAAARRRVGEHARLEHHHVAWMSFSSDEPPPKPPHGIGYKRHRGCPPPLQYHSAADRPNAVPRTQPLAS